MEGHPLQGPIDAYWAAREAAATTQEGGSRRDTGQRAAVTAGTQLTALEDVLVSQLVTAGVDPLNVYRGRSASLPGYYRVVKNWDLVVVEDDVLVAAIEFKSQAGPSFGNNLNNRSEEAIGSASDVWAAYQKGAFGSVAPWLGYVFLLEECPKSTHRVAVPDRVRFPVDPVFEGSSYRDRYQILCGRLVKERLYNASCFLSATKGPPSVITEPDAELGFAEFSAALAGRVADVHARRAFRGYRYLVGDERSRIIGRQASGEELETD